jgi:hypothetical protein
MGGVADKVGYNKDTALLRQVHIDRDFFPTKSCARASLTRGNAAGYARIAFVRTVQRPGVRRTPWLALACR